MKLLGSKLKIIDGGLGSADALSVRVIGLHSVRIAFDVPFSAQRKSKTMCNFQYLSPKHGAHIPSE